MSRSTLRALVAGILSTAALLGGCRASDAPSSDDVPGVVELHTLELEYATPGRIGVVEGLFAPGMAWDLSLRGTLDGAPVTLALETLDHDVHAIRFAIPPAEFDAVAPGRFVGELVTRGTDARGGAVEARMPVSFEVQRERHPELEGLEEIAFASTPIQVGADGLLDEGEGTSWLVLSGQMRLADGGAVDLEETAAEIVHGEGWAQVVLDPEWLGIAPGVARLDARIVNEGIGWQARSPSRSASLSLMPPVIDRLGVDAASRGQAIVVVGRGFVGPPGRTVIRMDGTFRPLGGQPRPIREDSRVLVPRWLDGQTLVFTFRPRIDGDCASDDIGGEPGRLSATLTPVVSIGSRDRIGAPHRIEFDVLSTRQVVWLRFLPAFIDSLRLFGLRGVSGRVRSAIVARVRAGFAGLAVDIRTEQPRDFVDYTIVDIGGPDPNNQSLFGLDNSAGFDACNARLDDRLAGRNAETGQFGGVFVESFLRLSHREHPDNPLADPRFDAIVDPLVAASRPGARPAGSDEVQRAVGLVAALVGQTIVHEIGHAVGLSRDPGCGDFHNHPGPRQIMDCGADRPFAERAELGPDDIPRFTDRNRAYLEEILPERDE